MWNDLPYSYSKSIVIETAVVNGPLEKEQIHSKRKIRNKTKKTKKEEEKSKK